LQPEDPQAPKYGILALLIAAAAVLLAIISVVAVKLAG
jgi:hypothetical protein